MKEKVKMMKGSQEVEATILGCFELENGKNYLVYHFEDETDDVYVSSIVDKDDEIELHDVSDDEMELVQKIIDGLAEEGE